MSTRFERILVLVLCGILCVNKIWFLLPYFKTTSRIEREVLQMIPLGTHMNDVVQILEKKEKWFISIEGRFHDEMVSWSVASESEEFWRNLDRYQTIRICLRDYGHPLYYYVFAHEVTLSFDNSFFLVRVKARKAVLVSVL